MLILPLLAYNEITDNKREVFLRGSLFNVLDHDWVLEFF